MLAFETRNAVPPGGMVFDKATLVDRPQNFAPVAGGSIPVVVVHTHTVTIQRPDESAEKISRQRAAKMSSSHVHDKRAILSVLGNISLILNFPTHRRPYTVSLHGSALRNGNAGSDSFNFGDSTTSPHDVEEY